MLEGNGGNNTGRLNEKMSIESASGEFPLMLSMFGLTKVVELGI